MRCGPYHVALRSIRLGKPASAGGCARANHRNTQQDQPSCEISHMTHSISRLFVSVFKLARTVSDFARHWTTPGRSKLWRLRLLFPKLTLSSYCFLFTVAAAATTSAAEPPDFSRNVRPILADNCFKCHGPDPATREAEIRLDVPGDVQLLGDGSDNEIVARITSDDPDLRMPPPDTGKTLAPGEVATIQQWIAAGAPYTDHWAFVRPERPTLPEVEGAEHPIDRFLLSRLRTEGLEYSEQADGVTLLRRIYFDLIGLPPTPEQVAAFVADSRPDAFERVIDGLLASPHYGERMAIYWLDLVRYADTNGYHGDNYRSVWPYRDYVIAAFNDNKPFDEFTIEQLAGDLLPDATREQRVASAYNRLNMITAEGGAQPKEYLAKYAADRVRTTSTAWLGITLGCAECHDHKFDPISTADFYRFAAYFADLKERGLYGIGQWDPELPLPSDEQAAKLEQLDGRLASLDAEITAMTSRLANEQLTWEADLRSKTRPADLAFEPVAPQSIKTAFGGEVETLPDKSVLSQGKNHVNETYICDMRTDLETITAVRLEALTHPSLAGGGLTRGGNGNFVLTEFTVDLLDPADKAPPERIDIARAEASFEAPGSEIDNALDPSPENGWSVQGHLQARDRHALFVFDKPIVAGPGTRLRIHIRHESIYADHVIGRFRLSLSSTANPQLPVEPVPDDVLRAVHVQRDARSEAQSQLVTDYYQMLAPKLDELRQQKKSLAGERKKLEEKIPTVLVSVSVEPRTMRILPRGNWMDESGEEVSPAPPAVLIGKARDQDRRQSRHDLAQWLVDKNNPLTARVFVNRLWKLLHGSGLCRTLDDFGAQGEPPRYAELLDWLAVEFVESGWDVKHMIRLMAASRCYRQTSTASAELAQLDPQNARFARQQSFRVAAEMVRDNALAVSGLLVPKIGGPSVKPYQPAGYWSQLNFPPREYEADHGESLYRRGLYTYWMRTFLHPSMRAFDAPPREECTVVRPQSSTPLQALVLLNDPSYVEAARALAVRIMTESPGNEAERVAWAYEQVLSRPPSSAAKQALLVLHEKTFERAAHAKTPEAIGEFNPPEGLDLQQLAAWTAVSRVLLNLHETITRY